MSTKWQCMHSWRATAKYEGNTNGWSWPTCAKLGATARTYVNSRCDYLYALGLLFGVHRHKSGWSSENDGGVLNSFEGELNRRLFVCRRTNMVYDMTLSRLSTVVISCILQVQVYRWNYNCQLYFSYNSEIVESISDNICSIYCTADSYYSSTDISSSATSDWIWTLLNHDLDPTVQIHIILQVGTHILL